MSSAIVFTTNNGPRAPRTGSRCCPSPRALPGISTTQTEGPYLYGSPDAGSQTLSSAFAAARSVGGRAKVSRRSFWAPDRQRGSALRSTYAELCGSRPPPKGSVTSGDPIPEHPRHFHPGRMVRLCPRRHVVLPGCSRLLQQVEVAGGVAPGEPDQFGDDLAADLGAVVGHFSTVRRNRTSVLELRRAFRRR